VAHTVLSLIVALALAGAAVLGFEPAISPRQIDEAIALGQSRIESARTRFHQPYRLQVSRSPFDYIDVVTPFRRVVLITEERTALGIRGFTQREATAALGNRGTILELRVEMTFHPLNTFVGVPGYEVELVSGSPPARLMAGEVTRIPRFGARIDAATLPALTSAPLPNQRGGGGMPLTGGTIVASFPVGTLKPGGAYDVVVSEMGKELVRVPVNLGGLR
jgi:hypothetical protein